MKFFMKTLNEIFESELDTLQQVDREGLEKNSSAWEVGKIKFPVNTIFKVGGGFGPWTPRYLKY